QEREWLRPGEPVRVEVEIWPTCMVFKKGHRIRLDISPRDGIGAAPYTHYCADYNSGTNTVYGGGGGASDPVLPGPRAPQAGARRARTRQTRSGRPKTVAHDWSQRRAVGGARNW